MSEVDVFLIVVMAISLALLALNFYFHAYRNNLVYKARTSVESINEWRNLPTYNQMLYSPLKWSGRKLKKMARGDK